MDWGGNLEDEEDGEDEDFEDDRYRLQPRQVVTLSLFWQPQTISGKGRYWVLPETVRMSDIQSWGVISHQ